MSLCDTCGGKGIITFPKGGLMCPDCQRDPETRERLGKLREVFADVEKNPPEQVYPKK